MHGNIETAMGWAVRALPHANETPRGQTTFIHVMPDGMQHTIYKRAAGTTFGGHFHTGKTPTGKNSSRAPEHLFLIAGVIELWILLPGGELFCTKIDASRYPQLITIEPYVLHGGKVIHDAIYTEILLSPFDPNDADVHDGEAFIAFARKRHTEQSVAHFEDGVQGLVNPPNRA